MERDVVIRVEGLGKRYALGARSNERYTALRDVIANSARDLFRRRPVPERAGGRAGDFWALKDVSFEVRRGEVLGIIGRNGAGKSTLLKILSRITEPTEGRIRIQGRVASLLEVGTGFHPELTGRENIFLNGAILGMRRVEIKARFDEIVAFAEVERFLDTPVKRYSSGMYVRLAFAVAAHLEPEILIVDEVLAVGDAQFQKKCLGKMQDVATSGRTVIFVSHNLGQISALSHHGILLNFGRITFNGDVQHALSAYNRDKKGRKKDVSLFGPLAESVDIAEIQLEGEIGESQTLPTGTDGILHVGLRFHAPLKNVRITVALFSDGIRICTAHEVENAFTPVSTGRLDITCKLPLQFLRPGRYSIGVGVVNGHPSSYAWDADVIAFEILDDAEDDTSRSLLGLLSLPMTIKRQLPVSQIDHGCIA